MTTLDFTPTRVDLKLYAGSDVSIRFFLSTDAPAAGSFEGTWSATTGYTPGQIVEYASAFYASLDPSTNITPGTAVTEWRQLTPLDLTGYTGWASQIRSSATSETAFTVDATSQADSLITISMTKEALQAIQADGAQAWDLHAVDGSGNDTTLFAGTAVILAAAEIP